MGNLDILTARLGEMSRTRIARAQDGRRLKTWRIERGWTQAQVAAAVHVAPNTVARWERGERTITNRTWAQLMALPAAG